MGRLDTALNGKNGVRFGHTKITYEVPCNDCPNPHDCDPDCTWNPIKEKCDCPCEPEDPGYECNCSCEDGEVCIDGECRETADPGCGECHSPDPVTGECAFDPTLPGCSSDKKCPEGWLEDEDGNCYCENCHECESPCRWDYYEGCVCPGSDKKVCGKCYSIDPVTGECVPDPTKCPEEECEDGWHWDDDVGDCVKDNPRPPYCLPGDPECPLEKDDCFDWVNVGDGAIMNADNKITGKPGSTKRNGQRYWYSTMCYNRIEFFARITTEGEGVNKSGIEHGYAETKGDLSYIATGYYGDFVQLHHDDVLKIIIYSDGREETYIKSFIRPGVWTGWEVYSNIKRPETPPSGKINWMMCGVFGGAEIWDVRAYPTDEVVISIDDAVIETPPQNVGGCIDYELQGCQGDMCGYCEAFGTVRDSNDKLGKTMYFGWSNPFRWANGETKRNYVTYRDGVLTIPKGSTFKYVGPMMNYPNNGVGWRTDMKFRVNCPSNYGSGKVFVWFGVCDENGENPNQRLRWEWYASDLVNRDLWFTYETAYTCTYPEYVENAMLYYWTGTGEYRGYDMINSAYNFINHDHRGPWYYYIEIQIQDNCNINSIDVSYMSEGKGSYYIRY